MLSSSRDLTGSVCVAAWLALAFADAAQANGGTRVVDDDGQASAASCQDATPAFATVSAAIAAATAGETVLVCPGTYFENITFLGKAIAVRSTDGPAVTVIDGNAADSVVTFASGEGAASILEGFTVRNGRSAFDTLGFGEGGGIRIANASPTIRGNVILNNRGCDGVGISVRFGSPLIEDNSILGNVRAGCSGGNGGGGIGIVGTSTALIRANLIANNFLTDGNGGGISLNGAGAPRIERNAIVGNSVGGAEGGGIWMVNQSDATIVGNLIVGNTAGWGGGVFWLIPTSSPLLVNNTLADNDSPEGSAIFADGFDGTAQLVNNILIGSAGQTAVVCGNFNDMNPPIFRSNNVFSPSGQSYGGICLDQTGLNGNISGDPLFTNAGIGNYHLLLTSPAIDAGDNTASALPATDLDGEVRVLDGDGDGVAVVDMGADEFPAAAGPRGIITGTVTDASTGTGIGALTVQVYRSTGSFAKSTSTTSSGAFTVTGLISDTYYVRTFASGAQNYVDELYDNIPCLSCAVTTGTPIAVVEEETSSGVDFALSAAGAIAGTVTGASTSTLLTGVTVQVYTSTGTFAKSATTLNGAYTVTGLPPGTYHARTVVPNLQHIYPSLQNYVNEVYDNIECLNCVGTAGTPIVVTAGTTRTGVDFTLSQGGNINGSVTDALSRAGLGGVMVPVYTSTGSLAKEALTASGGNYTVDGLPSGTYYARTAVPSSLNYLDELYDNLRCVNCTVTTGTPIAVTAGAQTVVNFSLLPIAASLVPGRVFRFTLAGAAETRWVSTAVVGGRSYCAQLAPASTAVDRATPTLEAAIYLSYVTYGLGSSATRVCFVAPFTESAWLKITQTDAGARSYALTVMETTLWANWFYVSGSYSSYTILRNTTDTVVFATITWRAADTGASLGSVSDFVAPRGVRYYDARWIGNGASAGSVEVAHDGEPEALVGSQTTLSGATGLSFDTLFFHRSSP